MAATSAGKFSCDACGKSYSWKPELAGRRVKCKCGQPMSVPRDDPAAAATSELPPEFEDLYALAQGEPVHHDAATPPPISRSGGACPSCGAGVDAGDAVCISCGHQLKQPKKTKSKPVKENNGGGGGGGIGAPALAGAGAGGGRRGGGGGALAGYAQMAARRNTDAPKRSADVYFHPVKDLYLPAGFVVVGLILSFIVLVYQHGVSPGGAILGVLFGSIFSIIITIPGILLTIRMFELGIGPIGPGIVKLAACAILPGALGEMIAMIFNGQVWGYIGWFVSYLATCAIFMKLLDMDFFETMVCSAIIFVVRTWLGYALMFAILRGLGIGDLPGGPGFTPGAGRITVAGEIYDPDDDEESLDRVRAKQSDERATMMLQHGGTDGKKWMEEKPTRRLAGQTRDKSLKIMNDFFDAGVHEIRVYPLKNAKGDEITDMMIVCPPRDEPENKSSRAKCFTQLKALAKYLGRITPSRDRGERYWPVHMLTPKEMDAKEPGFSEEGAFIAGAGTGNDDDEDGGPAVGRGKTPKPAAPPPPPPPTPGELLDMHSKGMLNAKAKEDANLWSAENKNYFYGFKPDESAEIVKTLLSLGCTQPVALDLGVEGDGAVSSDALVCLLPTTPKARAKVIEYYESLRKRKNDLDEVEEQGQKYLSIVFNRNYRPFPRGPYKPKEQ